MRNVQEALAAVEQAAGEVSLREESVPLAEALGRILARDVVMDHDVPPFRRAAMDGFALHAGERAPGARFQVQGAVMAGQVPQGAVAPGAAVRVMTGAPVPEGAGAVVPLEWTRQEGARMIIERLPKHSTNIVPRGDHVQAGAVVLAAGTAISPGCLGALASAGCARVPLAARPRVALIGTGSELVPVDCQPHPGAIRNSNSATLLGQCRRVGAEPLDLGIAPDDAGRLEALVAQGLEADLLLLSGGVSAGDLDLVPAALQAAGVECIFHRWAVQPGGPLWFGRRGKTLVFGLPGNPAATFVGFEVLVVPALRTRVGLKLRPRRTLRALYDGPWGPASSRRRFRPVTLETNEEARLWAHAQPWRGSGDPFGLAGGEALAVIPEDVAAPAAGAACLEVIATSEAPALWGTP